MPPSSRRRSLRAIARAAVLVIGVSASLAAALLLRDSIDRQHDQQFATLASGVSSRLEATLQRDADLMLTAQTIVARTPRLTNAQFQAWFGDLAVSRRLPGAYGIEFVEKVTAASLGTFIRTLRADSPAPIDHFALFPRGARPYYCLTRFGDLYSPTLAALVSSPLSPIARFATNGGFDYCDAKQPVLAATGASGALFVDSLSGVLPDVGLNGATLGGFRPLYFLIPVYRGGGSPGTATARRARWIGVIQGVFEGGAILGQAIAGNTQVSLVLDRRNAFGKPIELAQLGHAPNGSMRRTLRLHAGGAWTLSVAASPFGGLSADAQGGLVLIAGLALTVLLALTLQRFATTRERALTLARRAADELRHRERYDSVTGLASRALVVEETKRLLDRVLGDGHDAALLLVDLDGFKDVNQTRGHSTGDALLRAVGGRLRSAVRSPDAVGRFGADEFVVLLGGAASTSGAAGVAARLLELVAEPFWLEELPGTPISISASIGIASSGLGETTDPLTAEELLARAGLALGHAKRSGRGIYAVFSDEMRTAAESRHQLEMDLRVALGAEQYRLLYQPIVDLRSRRMIAAEALLRWRHPRRGAVGPATFIPVLEDIGLIVEVGRWVINEATRQAQSWRAQGYDLAISINVSARQLTASDLVDDVQAALERSGLDPSALTLEITETALARDTTTTIERLDAIKQLGAKLAIDDFGTGYSSLAYLQQFPIDTIKIDRSFIAGSSASPEGRALVHTLVQLGKALHLETLAEGIERIPELEQLLIEGCDSGQGLLFGQPMSGDALLRFLLHERAPATTRI